jgi:hypothetical protein
VRFVAPLLNTKAVRCLMKITVVNEGRRGETACYHCFGTGIVETQQTSTKCKIGGR